MEPCTEDVKRDWLSVQKKLFGLLDMINWALLSGLSWEYVFELSLLVELGEPSRMIFLMETDQFVCLVRLCKIIFSKINVINLMWQQNINQNIVKQIVAYEKYLIFFIYDKSMKILQCLTKSNL